jgi:hypothetical protein
VAGADDASRGTTRTEGWSRQRGIVAAVVAILVVVLTLVLSRLDLGNELSVAQADLDAANQELAANQQEIDDLEDQARASTESLEACRDSAELGQQISQALETLQRGLSRGNEALIARGVADFVERQREWSAANDQCLQATQEAPG